jgi:lipopolysaccharide export system protein LptA
MDERPENNLKKLFISSQIFELRRTANTFLQKVYNSKYQKAQNNKTHYNFHGRAVG